MFLGTTRYWLVVLKSVKSNSMPVTSYSHFKNLYSALGNLVSALCSKNKGLKKQREAKITRQNILSPN